MDRRKTGIILVTVSILITLVAAVLANKGEKESTRTIAGSGKVAVIYLTGTITSTQEMPIWGTGSSTSLTMKYLEEVEKDDSIDAVVLRIDSPGGSANASQELYEQVLRVKKSGKKVVASFGDTAASGGYYVAAAADKIVAGPSSLTGSIGVISTVPNLEELYNKIGYKERVFKSGPYKDMLSPSRPLTPEEEEIMQGIIDDTYNQFINAVAKGRKMSLDQVRKLADGRIFTGNQAKEVGLVDELGGKREAIQLATELAGIKGEPEVVEYRRIPGWLDVFQRFGILSPKSLLFPAYTTIQY